MADIQFSLDPEDYNRLKEKMKGLSLDEQNSIFYKAFVNVAATAHAQLVNNVSNRILRHRTGDLSESIQFRIETTGKGLTAYIGANVLTGARLKYANILETGGRITPKKKKFLTIPLQPALYPSGASRMPRATDWPNTFIKKTQQKRLIIFQKRGKKKIVALYLLLKKVEMPDFRYLSRSLAQVKPRVLEIMSAFITRALNK